MNFAEVLKHGISDGLKTTWELTKIIVPIYYAITFLKYTPVIHYMAGIFRPVTSLAGLPGEAALPIIFAAVINIYPAIAAITALSFSAKEITILATMVAICHNLPVEATLAKKMGASAFLIVFLRALSAFIAGIILNLFLGG